MIKDDKYIDQRFKDLYKYLDKQFELDRKAVDQYSKTNDEWKFLHNGLQRKMEDDRAQYVTKEQLKEQSKLFRSWIAIGVSILGLLFTAYQMFK